MSGEVVPEHCGIFQVGLWVSFLCMDEEWELGRIPEEEDGCVVVYPVPVTLLCIELDGKASRITSGIWGTLLATDGRETGNARSLLADSRKHVD
jgi:hypothetical protein